MVPSKKKSPAYHEQIAQPIDLAAIEANVERGHYTSPAMFDADILRWVSNCVKFYGDTSTEADTAQQLLDAYSEKKKDCFDRLAGIVGTDSALLRSFVPIRAVNTSGGNQLLIPTVVDPNEDVIRCICGLYVDEGIMIQCSNCLCWQHTQCNGADTSLENYLCEQCDGNRQVDYEIRLDDTNVKGHQLYLSLLRGDLQVRQTDTVYVLRDIPITEVDGAAAAAAGDDGVVKKHTYETIGKVDFGDCDIFRIEQLWKDECGRRFAYGHHYLRPHETYHEPSRKFYQNEVMRVPLYEEVPIEMIMGRCWVLDPITFCKGRPVDAVEEHVYICELRVDKAAKTFAKVSKNQYPVCQKSYAFHKFAQKLKIQRTYMVIIRPFILNYENMSFVFLFAYSHTT